MVARRLSLFDNAMASGGVEQVTGAPTVISAAIYFETLPTRHELTTIVTEKLLPLDVFSSRPESGRWKPVQVDLDRHVLYHEVEGERDLDFFINTNAAEPLANKDVGPWWEIHAVSTREASAREMLFFRIEHACADGIALFQVLSRLTTTEDGQPLSVAEFKRPPKPKVNPCVLACDALGKFFKYAMAPVGPFDTQLPIHPPKESRHSGLRFSSRRRLVLVPEHPLQMIKDIREAAGHGTTVNDVVYAAFAGALRRHCLGRSPSAPLDTTTRVRALVPLAFPRAASAPPGNDWTFLSVAMPVGESSGVDRLRAAHATFAAVKGSPEAHAARLAVQINALSPPALLGTVAQQLFSRHTLVFSNVPGPAAPVFLAGKKVVAMFSAYPNLISQVLCISYNGTMFMSIACDDALPEPEALAELYLDELRLLADEYGVAREGADVAHLPAPPPTPPAPPPDEPHSSSQPLLPSSARASADVEVLPPPPAPPMTSTTTGAELV